MKKVSLIGDGRCTPRLNFDIPTDSGYFTDRDSTDYLQLKESAESLADAITLLTDWDSLYESLNIDYDLYNMERELKAIKRSIKRSSNYLEVKNLNERKQQLMKHIKEEKRGNKQ